MSLLKQLLLQQVKLLQKEESENFQRFCSRSSREHTADSNQQPVPLGLNHLRKKSRESYTNRQSLRQKSEERCSDRGSLSSEITHESVEESTEQYFDAQDLHSEEHSKEYSKERGMDEMQYRISGDRLAYIGDVGNTVWFG